MSSKNTNPLLQSLKKETGSIPVAQLVRQTDLAVTLSKLVKPQTTVRRDQYGNREMIMPDISSLQSVSQSKVNDINDADTVMQLLPDMELGAQILQSSILAAKDMGDTTLTFLPPSDVVPAQTSAQMTDIIKDYFKNSYKIETKLQEWLRAILFERGSYTIAVIPENSLDEIITNNKNYSTESLSSVYDDKSQNLQPIGLLGKSDTFDEEKGRYEMNMKKGLGFSLEQYRPTSTQASDSDVLISMEAWDDNPDKNYALEGKYELFDPCISVTDNPAILSMGKLKDQLRTNAVSKMLGLGEDLSMESMGRFSEFEIENALYRQIQYKASPILSIKTNSQAYREAVGEPLILHIPSEAIIPVFIPGSPSQHVGYYVILDENGFPISKESNTDHYQSLNEMTASGKRSMASALIQRADRMYHGIDQDYNDKRKRNELAVTTYAEMVERDLISRLRNGIYGQSVKIGSVTEVFRIMFSRSLMQQHTQILFIPVELMTYMAFKFDDDGLGVSLLDNLKIINSLRVALMLAGTRSAVMNSIPRTKVNVKLDPNDPNPIKRREQFVNEYRMLRNSGNNGMPVGTTDPRVLEQWANQAGIEFSFTGHNDLPDMEVDINEHNSNVPQPDNELREQMDKKGIMGLGLTQENVDAAHGADFATTIQQNNLLFSRRVAQYQNAFHPLISDHVRKVVLNSPKLRGELNNVIMNNFEDVVKYLMPENTKASQISDAAKWKLSNQLLTTFMNKLNVSLPKPNGLSLKNKSEAFQEYMDSLDKSLEYVLSTESLPEGTIGRLSEAVDMARSVAKGHFAREWMVKNDYMPEVMELLSMDDDGKPVWNLWEVNASYAENMGKSLASFIDAVKNLRKTGDQYMEDNEQDDMGGDSGYSSDTSDDGDSSGEGGGDEFGMDGMDGGFGDDFSMDGEGGEGSGDGEEGDGGNNDDLGGMPDF